jgi:hypothetical protein
MMARFECLHVEFVEGSDFDCTYGKIVYFNGVLYEFKEVHKIILILIYNLWNHKEKKGP